MGGLFTSSIVTNLTYRNGVTSAYPVGLRGGTLEDVDLAGNPRLRDGEKVDLGCYQALPLPGLMLMLK